jgi:hypothetical protein|tara:strand:+ start:2583 stop:2993 length:411 start_codon:yes stop_codon:yes gene_type:complete
MALPIGSIIKELFSGGVTDLVDEVVTSKEEKLVLKNKLKELENNYTKIVEDNITQRWQADTNSSMLARNIRPASLIFLLFIFVVISFLDGNIGEFKLAAGYQGIYQSLLLVAFSAYFGSRGLEKITKIKTDGKQSL